MFGKNEIVGQKYFKDVEPNSLFVTSVFVTIQGEGPFSGMPAVFVRLAKCNLACSFCDTFFDDGDWFTYDELRSLIHKRLTDFYGEELPQHADYFEDNYMHSPRRMVLVVTGGEPSLQKNLSGFLDLMRYEFLYSQIESNGILKPPVPDCTTVVISPKCIEKNGKPVKYFKPHDSVLDRADCLKFVVEANPDSFYHGVPEWALKFADDGGDVYVSPMNIYNDAPAKSKEMRNSGANRIELEERSTVDEVISFWEPGLLNMEDNQANHEFAANYALTHGLKLSLQTHLYASLA